MIELNDICLSSKSGLEGKIRKLIIEEVKHKKIYIKEERQVKYKSNHSAMSAKYSGYSNTYNQKVVDKYLYTKKDLKNWFKENKTITFNKKVFEIDTSFYLSLIKEA